MIELASDNIRLMKKHIVHKKKSGDEEVVTDRKLSLVPYLKFDLHLE